jgi:hypothetical protein
MYGGSGVVEWVSERESEGQGAEGWERRSNNKMTYL